MANANTVSCGVGVLSALVVASTASQLAAQEYCVSCAAPKAVYRCVLENAVPTGIPLKSICTETLKRQGNHAKCAVRPGTIFDCDAPIRRIDVKSASGVLARPPTPQAKPHHAPAAGPDKAAPPPASPAAPARPAGPPTAPPAKESDARHAPSPAKQDGAATPLENLTQGLSRATRDTGEAIQNSTRKTLDCISSLFKSC